MKNMQANEGKAKQGAANIGKAKVQDKELQEDCREREQEREPRTRAR